MSKLLPHTKLLPGSVSTIVLVCGDPARATKISEFLDEPELLADYREYRTYRGGYNGRTVTVCSHGIGSPGAAIAFEELIVAGAKAIIRVGSCGGIRADIQAGDLVIATAAVDNTGYGREVAPSGFPAVADVNVIRNLQQAAGERPYHAGLVLTQDAFYGGIATPFAPDFRLMDQANVLAVEMECAALFIIGSLRQVQTGAVLAVDGNVLHVEEMMGTFNPHTAVVQQATTAAIQIALDAMVRLEDEFG
ncbi:MAG: nucleoside phosphorylase [Chloroflexi bacterium]|nr:nucleoside phosphorylase [Chloroflexota bacterium]